MAQKALVGKLVLTHIVADAVDDPATIQAIGEIFRGEVVVGHDLLEVTCGDPAETPVPRSPRAESEGPAH
jgi:ribonuclease BN (tRNA processing enzyme)